MRAKLSGEMHVPQEDRLLAKSELIVEKRRDNQNQEFHRFGRRGVGTHREGRGRGGQRGMRMDCYKRLRMGLLKLASQLDMRTLQPYDVTMYISKRKSSQKSTSCSRDIQFFS